jgi:hypothetical protein
MDSKDILELLELTPREIYSGAKGILKSKLGKDKASEELFNSRKEICLNCDKIIPDNKDFDIAKCGKCKCRLKHKLADTKQKCPLNKW